MKLNMYIYTATKSADYSTIILNHVVEIMQLGTSLPHSVRNIFRKKRRKGLILSIFQHFCFISKNEVGTFKSLSEFNFNIDR